jgi:hypothetical protein
MESFNQGGLDSMCGVYSLINANRLIQNTNKAKSIKLFGDIIEYLDSTEALKSIIIDGMNFTQLKKIIENVESLNFKEAVSQYQGVSTPNLDDFWDKIQAFLDEPNRAVLLGITGIYKHWTVIESISAKRIHFFDSGVITYFNKTNCAVANMESAKNFTGKELHLLYPAQTIFLEGK